MKTVRISTRDFQLKVRRKTQRVFFVRENRFFFFCLQTRTENNMKYAKENSGSYLAGSQPRCPLPLLVPPKGIHLSGYKEDSLRSNEAINSTGTASYRRTNYMFHQALRRKEQFTVCSNKYMTSKVKNQKHLSELLEIMRLLFGGMYIMEYPSRPSQGTNLHPPQE